MKKRQKKYWKKCTGTFGSVGIKRSNIWIFRVAETKSRKNNLKK